MASMEDEVRRVLDTIPELICTADRAGHADFANRRWCEYTGMTVAEAGGLGWQAAIEPEDLPRLLDQWKSIAAAGAPREIEARIRRSDGVYRWFLFRCSPLSEADGEVTRWYVTSADIDDRRRAEDALRRARKTFARSSMAFPAWSTRRRPRAKSNSSTARFGSTSDFRWRN